MLVITALVKEMAATAHVDTSRPFKVVVIHDADRLSRPAQAALRRTMEKYMRNLRMILIATSTSNIIAPIRSRCLLLRIPAPQTSEILKILTKVAEREGKTLPTQLARRIASSAQGNLRKSLLTLESCAIQ